jgi:hypothetical protein
MKWDCKCGSLSEQAKVLCYPLKFSMVMCLNLANNMYCFQAELLKNNAQFSASYFSCCDDYVSFNGITSSQVLTSAGV